MLQEKANHFGALPDLGKDFNCSLSWIQRFKNRHDIVFGKISGESAEVDIDVGTKWLENISPTMRAGYNHDDIFNADEAGLCYRLFEEKVGIGLPLMEELNAENELSLRFELWGIRKSHSEIF